MGHLVLWLVELEVGHVISIETLFSKPAWNSEVSKDV
jgi:hypothetical protein